jgi:hypothetical protein
MYWENEDKDRSFAEKFQQIWVSMKAGLDL